MWTTLYMAHGDGFPGIDLGKDLVHHSCSGNQCELSTQPGVW